jgi:hypothetical protein
VTYEERSSCPAPEVFEIESALPALSFLKASSSDSSSLDFSFFFLTTPICFGADALSPSLPAAEVALAFFDLSASF